jgi:hypothetical protein
MRLPRVLTAGAALAAVIAAAAFVLTGAPESRAEPSQSQRLFRAALLADERTSSAIRRLLADRRGIVAPQIAFTDLTGDGRSDAVVRVDTGGAAGTVAVYVFSTDGAPGDELRAVYRSQQLHRGVIRAGRGALVVRTPEWEPGDDVCCPSMQRERTYTWSRAAMAMRLRGSREVPTERR